MIELAGNFLIGLFAIVGLVSVGIVFFEIFRIIISKPETTKTKKVLLEVTDVDDARENIEFCLRVLRDEIVVINEEDSITFLEDLIKQIDQKVKQT